MLSLPLPFVVALFLLVLVVRIGRNDEGGTGNGLVVFVAACAVQAVVVGLRWGYDVPLAKLIQPVSASILPGLAWVGFAGSDPPARWLVGSTRVHALPSLMIAGFMCLWRTPIDLVLAFIFVGYGSVLIGHSRRSITMPAVRIGDEAIASRAAIATGLLLIASGLVDALIGFDFAFVRGVHAPAIVTIENVATLAVAGYVASVAERTRPRTMALPDAPPDVTKLGAGRTEPSIDHDDVSVLRAVDTMMRERKLYRDPDLTLDRLARRAGISARQISAALNRAYGRNVSQIVNEYRIAEAQRLLTRTVAPVTDIMLEAGFQTKSNFNREFKRVTGMTPSDYRRLGVGRK